MATAVTKKSVAVLHAGGYAGRELTLLLLRHPFARVTTVTSRTFAGAPVHAAHPSLRGLTEMHFVDPDALNVSGMDAILLTAEHGKAALTVQQILRGGFEGPIVDLSADFRFSTGENYESTIGVAHPAPALLPRFAYGLAEVCAPYPGRLVSNPGCFATGIALSLWPLSRTAGQFQAKITALTGASGAGTRPKTATHFPTREGNVRAYRTLAHQHLPEVLQILGSSVDIAFVPVSGPWTRGIWGTAHITLPGTVSESDVTEWFEAAYPPGRCVRLWPGQLPELRYAVGTPYCDIGWVVRNGAIVIGFALDNLLKGAASQAVQNLNLVMGWPEMAGLLP